MVKRFAELIFEILIAAAIVGALVVFAIKVPPESRLAGKWVALGFNTVLVFGMLMFWFRDFQKRTRFWVYTLGALTAHVILFVLLLKQVHRWPTMFFVITDFLEWAVMVPILLPATYRRFTERHRL